MSKTTKTLSAELKTHDFSSISARVTDHRLPLRAAAPTQPQPKKGFDRWHSRSKARANRNRAGAARNPAKTMARAYRKGLNQGRFPRPELGSNTELPEERRLTPRERKFIEGYIQTASILKAAASAGQMCPRTAYEMWRDPAVAKVLLERADELYARLGVTTDRIIAEQAAIAFFDPRTVFDEDGNLLPIEKWPDLAAAALASMEIEEFSVGKGLLRKVKFNSKSTALDALMRNQGLFEKDNRQPGQALGESIGQSLGDQLREAMLALTEKLQARAAASNPGDE